MKKSLILPVLGAVVIIAAGGSFAFLKYRHDPLRDGRALLAKGDLRGASIDLRTAVRDAPGNRDAHFALAQLHMRAGDPVAAEKELRAAADLGYDPSKIKPLLAQTYLDQQKFKQLLADFPVPPGASESVAPILIARGLAMFALKDSVAAQASIAQAEQLDPKNPDAPYASARVAFATRDLAMADQKVDRTLEINPHAAPARLLKSELLNTRGDKAGAIDQLNKAIEDSPHYEIARLERANLLIITGEDAKAKADVDAVLAENPNNGMATYLDTVLMVRKKDYTAANIDLQKISTVLNRFPRALFFDAVVKANLGQTAQATDSATRYVAQNPSDLDGVKLLARIHLGNKRPDLAADVLSTAANAGRRDAELLDLLGRSYALAGKSPEALKSYTQAAELAPNSPELLARIANTRLGMGDIRGATADLKKSLALAPNQANLAEDLVVTAMASGNLAAANAALDNLRAAQGETELVGTIAGLLKVVDVDLDGAQAQFRKVLAAFPNSVATRLNIVKVMDLQGQHAEAEAALNALVQQKPTDESAVNAFAGWMVDDNRPSRAIEVLEKAHTAAPTNADFTAALVDLYIKAGDAQKAMLLLDDATKDQASVPVLLGARARAQVALGKPKDAIETYRRILAVSNSDVLARTRLVDLLMNADDFDGAKAVLRDGLRLFPGNLAILGAIVRADMRAGGVDNGLATAGQLASDPANLPAARLLKGDTYVGARRFDKAAEAYAAELKAGPTSVLTVRYALALNLAGKPDLAIDALTDWVSKHPDDADALMPLSALELTAKRYKEAQGHLETVLETRPNDGPTINNLAWIYQKIGDQRAMGLAQRAYLISPTSDTADTFGWMLETQGQPAKAVILLRQAVAKTPNNGIILYHYAVALKDSGQREEAIKTLVAATAAPGEFDERGPARKLLADLSAPH